MAGTVVVDAVKSSTTGAPTFQNTSGTEIGQLCRAWVNFNGTGTVAIRAAFNVSSITDNGTGNYTVNFTTAMPDANYSAQIQTGFGATSGSSVVAKIEGSNNYLTSGFRLKTNTSNTVTDTDSDLVTVAVFR